MSRSIIILVSMLLGVALMGIGVNQYVRDYYEAKAECSARCAPFAPDVSAFESPVTGMFDCYCDQRMTEPE